MVATAHVDNTMTPGRLAREAAGGFHELRDGTNVTATGNTGWLDKGFVHDCTLHLELGTCTGTGTSMTVTLEQADEDDGTGAEALAITAAADQDDDNTALQAPVCIDKRYVRLSWVVAGTTPVFPLTATLRNAKDHRNFGDYGLAWV